MIKITAARRATARVILADNSYDPDTMIITRDGMVTAYKDLNKTFGGHVICRYNFGYLDNMVAADGTRLEGY